MCERDSPPFVEAEVGQEVVDGEERKIRSLDGQKPCGEEKDHGLCVHILANKSLLALENKHVYRIK